MPVQAVTHCSPADYRRIAWSLVMTELKELDGQADPAEAAALTGDLTTPHDLAMLAAALIDLATMLFAKDYPSTYVARAAAAQIALNMACEQ